MGIETICGAHSEGIDFIEASGELAPVIDIDRSGIVFIAPDVNRLLAESEGEMLVSLPVYPQEIGGVEYVMLVVGGFDKSLPYPVGNGRRNMAGHIEIKIIP